MALLSAILAYHRRARQQASRRRAIALDQVGWKITPRDGGDDRWPLPEKVGDHAGGAGRKAREV